MTEPEKYPDFAEPGHYVEPSEDTPTDLATREHPVGPYRYDQEPL